MTAVDKYILAIKNYKNIGGSLDDAIVIAETLLKEAVEREKKSLYTEEQVREAIDMARKQKLNYLGDKWIIIHQDDEIIQSLKAT